jgi:hypothetical protein
MSNNLSGVLKLTDEHRNELPYLIWYPALAAETTYAELACRNPGMRQAVTRAAIIGNMPNLFNKLMAEDLSFCPDGFVLAEAESSPHANYRIAIEQRAEELGLDLSFKATSEKQGHEDWKWYSVRPDASHFSAYPRTRNLIDSIVGPGDIAAGRENMATIYNGMGCDASAVEMFVSLPEDLRPKEFVELDYVQWPPRAD